MSKIKSLPGQRLCSSLPPDRVPWETSDAIPRNGHRKVAPQPRALKALELALHIHTAGYNIYLSGGKAAQSAAQKEFAEEIRRLLEEQSERQEALLEEMNKNMKNISKNQKGKFSLFK